MKKLSCLLPLLMLAGLAAMPAPAQDKPKAAAHGRGYKPMPAAQFRALHAANKARHGDVIARLLKTVTPPAVFDCVTLGTVGPVVDQGQCGDCYGVSSSDACTGAFIKAGWGKNDGSFKISDQYGLDCGAYEGGCNGGDEAQVIQVMKTKGFPAEKYVDLTSGQKLSDYGPYQGSPGQCQLKAGAKLWQLQDWGYVAGDQGQGAATVDQLKVALQTYGQLSIALDASSFDSYTSGVITNLGNAVDHAITMVGWDDTKSYKVKGPDGNTVTATGAVHCRNNWGTSWGEQGYCWISYAAVPQIVEPIWLLAPSAQPTPPPVPPQPVPPTPPGPNPPPPVPPTPGTVTIPLTPEQVASVNAQSGATVITATMTLQQITDIINAKNGSVLIDKSMTLQQLLDAISASKQGKPPTVVEPKSPCPCPQPNPPTKADAQVAADLAELRQAVNEIMKRLVKEKQP